MGYVPDEVRAARAAALAPLFAILRERGLKRTWFARQIGPTGVSLNCLWRYQAGYDRVPPTFIERACQVLGIPASLIPIPEPRDLYIQQPRSVAQKGSQHGNLPASASDHSDHHSPSSDGQPVRHTRAPQAAPRAARTPRTPRAGATERRVASAG